MQDIIKERLGKFKKIRIRKKRVVAILLLLSLLVSLDVFWSLRQTGLTMAGDADCGLVEHTHDESCMGDGEHCHLQEHTHSIECYSIATADTETQLDWQEMFKNYPMTGDLRKDLVRIAKTQVGYSESSENFQMGTDGLRHGYTRYGAWYGTPYCDWSAIFVSFCLNYAGADTDKFPINTGANSMAELWKKSDRFAALGEYTPVSGDLVFFNNNTVGIVSEAYKASMYVIQGDYENAVCGNVMSMADSKILGWGITGDRKAAEQISGSDVDIFNRPTVVISEGKSTQTKSRGYSLRVSAASTEQGEEEYTYLLPYLEANDGDIYFVLLDMNNQPLPRDEEGNRIVYDDTGYKLSVSISSPNGFHTGTYLYQLPDGLIVDGGTGTFILQDGTNVGDWSVSDDGLVTLEFNENINSRTEITITAMMGVHFPHRDDPIVFDGNVTIVVEVPPEILEMTKITKWGKQGAEGSTDGKTDPTKIYWNVSITGHDNSHIVGNTLTDKVLTAGWLGTHKYTQSDMEAGLKFGATSPDNRWHSWNVYLGDPNLIWTEDGWSYVMPETINCWCGTHALGDDGWIYYIDYSSTPDNLNTTGTKYYQNVISIDNHYAEGSTQFFHGEVLGVIAKDGDFITDAGNGFFLWEVQATIPKMQEGGKAEYGWYIFDRLRLMNSEGIEVQMYENDAHLSTVTATFNGTTINVPNIFDATDDDMFAWHNEWTAETNGIKYGRQIQLVTRCHCTEDTCKVLENGKCPNYWYEKEPNVWVNSGFCRCWALDYDVTFTFVYKTTDVSAIEEYGGKGYSLQNIAELYYKPYGETGVYELASGAAVSVPIPGLFSKEITHDFDGYTANYKITVNEGKMVLTDGSPLTIHDVMTNTLVFINGSMIITAEDVNGNIVELQPDVDYTTTYDGTGNVTDINGNPVHVLDIVILHPQPVKYVLDYDATLIIPSTGTPAIKYQNSASVTLWGEKITDSSVEKVYANINIAARSYRVEMYKVSSLTGRPVEGATFGLFNERGGLIASDVTNVNGQLQFQTNVEMGIILREHALYYLQEIKAPDGYKLDETKHWFCFCNDVGDYCAHYNQLPPELNVTRIPLEQVGKFYIDNDPVEYNLPDTGGIGVYPLMLVSVMFIVTPLVYMIIPRRKRERRSAD